MRRYQKLLIHHCKVKAILAHSRYWTLPWWLSGKESAYNAGDLGSIPGLGRSPGGGHGDPLQYSCLENYMDRGAWQATVSGGHKELDTTD